MLHTFYDTHVIVVNNDMRLSTQLDTSGWKCVINNTFKERTGNSFTKS
jgi:hypothetical protein